jgi:hypothetical protein
MNLKKMDLLWSVHFFNKRTIRIRDLSFHSLTNRQLFLLEHPVVFLAFSQKLDSISDPFMKIARKEYGMTLTLSGALEEDF